MAQAAPDRLQVVGVVTRTQAEAERIAQRWGVPAVLTIDEVIVLDPEFVVAAVSWPAMPGVVRELVAAGVTVLAETPPAPDLDGLRDLWQAVGASGLIQVWEQYALMPGHASRLAVVGAGVIGVPTSVEIASTHLYHAVALMRAFLNVDMDKTVVTARSFVAPLVDPLTLDGWAADPRPEQRTTTIATLDFGEGRIGLYHFVENQWWKPLRARRIVIRGSLGEILNNTVTRLTTEGSVTSPIMHRRTGIDMNLEGNEVVYASFDGAVAYRNPWVGTRLSEDEIAVAGHLAAVGLWARDEGSAPYPLAQGCQDHALGLAIEESARTRTDARVAEEVWT